MAEANKKINAIITRLNTNRGQLGKKLFLISNSPYVDTQNPQGADIFKLLAQKRGKGQALLPPPGGLSQAYLTWKPAALKIEDDKEDEGEDDEEDDDDDEEDQAFHAEVGAHVHFTAHTSHGTQAVDFQSRH